MEAAHRRGLPVEVHGSGIQSKRVAVSAGVDLIEHPEIGELDDALIQLMLERKVICSMNTGIVQNDNSRRLVSKGCIISVAPDASLPPPPDGGLAAEFVRSHPSVKKPMFAALEGAVALDSALSATRLIPLGHSKAAAAGPF